MQKPYSRVGLRVAYRENSPLFQYSL